MQELAKKIEAAAWDRLPVDVRIPWETQIEVLLPAPPLFAELSTQHLTLETFNPRQLAEKVGHDSVLSGRILGVANSARFGLRQPMTSIQRAMVHLGFNLVKSVISTYMVESGFSKAPPPPDGHTEYVRRWTAGAAVLAFRWAQQVNLSDPATASTVALLARLGTLLLGAAHPPPNQNYRTLEYETDRLNYELATWEVPSPMLSGELARRWEIPRPIPGLLELLWKPAVVELPPDPLNSQLRLLVLVSASLELAALTPGQSCELIEDVEKFFAAGKRQPLLRNLELHDLLTAGIRVWRNPTFRREFDTIVA